MIAVIKKYSFCLWVSLIFSGLTHTVSAQTARDNFNSAKVALEEGNYSGSLIYLDRCQGQFGGSNVRIEALRAQCYVLLDDYVKAKIAYRNFYAMIDPAERGGETWEKMAELGKEIDAGLETADKAFKQKKEDEKKENLRQAEADIRQNETRKETKKATLNEKNGDVLYRLAVETRDPNALALYKEEAALTGNTSRTKKVEEELDKHKNPNKYLLPAVLDKNRSEAAYLIGLGGDKNLKNSSGNSLLHLAIDKEDTGMLQMLKEKGANLEIRNNRDETPLLYALQQNKYPISVNLLNLGGNAVATKNNGLNALHYALIYTTDARATAMLLEKGADANKTFSYGDSILTPLYYAVYFRKSPDLIQALIEHSAQVNEGKTGYTPLMAAVVRQDLALVELLLKNKADVNMTGLHNWTALHFAARENQPEIIAALLKAGATKKVKDEWGRTPRKVAYENELKASLKALRKS